MKVNRTRQIATLKFKFWCDKWIAFLSFVVFVALSGGAVYWASNLIKSAQ
jgi:hypothetical protein